MATKNQYDKPNLDKTLFKPTLKGVCDGNIGNMEGEFPESFVIVFIVFAINLSTDC